MIKKSIYLVICAVLFACDNTTPKPQSQTPFAIQNTTFSIPEYDDKLLRDLYNLQMATAKDPQNPDLKESFIKHSFFAEQNAFITFGNARKTHPKNGRALSTHLVRRAALLDAQRWAAYARLWQSDDLRPITKKIQLSPTHPYKEITSFTKGDSLIIVVVNKIK